MKIAYVIPELLRNLFRKPVTNQYPFEVSNPQVGFRGYPDFDSSKCIGCKLCQKNCPADEAIQIEQTAGFDNPKERKFKMRLFRDRCIRCGQCVFSCPVNALHMNEVFETAAFEREGYEIVEE